MEFFGYYGGPTRSPLLPLKDAQIAQLREIFKLFEGFQGWTAHGIHDIQKNCIVKYFVLHSRKECSCSKYLLSTYFFYESENVER